MVKRQPSKSADRKRRSEVVTVRLDPRLKYLAELAARRQRRPLSSYIEWAVELSLTKVKPDPDSMSIETETFADLASTLWDVDEPDRFAKLALSYPDLLNHDEQRLWKLIRESNGLWLSQHTGPSNQWVWTVNESNLDWERLREHWDTFRGVADGELDASKLPTSQTDEGGLESEPEPNIDDEVPF